MVRNKTIRLEEGEQERLRSKLLLRGTELEHLEGRVIKADIIKVAKQLPNHFVDFLFLDPPYNLSKEFGEVTFKKRDIEDYTEYLDEVITKLLHTLKDDACIYICGDWLTSTSIHLVAQKHFKVLNRITWQREKGRGSVGNWKSSHEDIWFCSKGKNYNFNVDAVKTRKKVLAPYRSKGQPKDWVDSAKGKFRDTHPSNCWSGLTVPFWSMKENTEHPTQKPENLLARLLLASSTEGDLVLDPFVGSGTSCVVAKKLGRRFLGFDIDEKWACITQKRLDGVVDNRIQGYDDGVFFERDIIEA